MCDRSKKKVEEAPPAALKILKRIRLQDKNRSSSDARVAEEVANAQTVKSSLREFSGTEMEFETEEAMDELEAFVQSDQDRLVEEILRKRRESREKSTSDLDLDNDDDDEDVGPEAEENGSLLQTSQELPERQSSSSGSGSEFSSESSKSKQTPSQGKSKLTVSAYLKERILFHGLYKYPEDYNKEKYVIPVPKAKKRIPSSRIAAVEELEGTDKGLGSVSNLSGSTTQSLDIVFSQQSQIFKPEASTFTSDVKTLTTKESTYASILKSNQTMLDEVIASQVRYRPKIEQDEPEEPSVTEQIVALETKKKKTMKERYIPYRAIKGYSNCWDETIGHPECLPPGEVARMAIRPDILCGVPINKPLKKEQFIKLMRCIQNYPTNDYVFLTYVSPPNSPNFIPYLFKIVAYKDINPKMYFTLSKSGVMSFQNGFAEYINTVKFIKQMFIFEHALKIPFFKIFALRKAFTIWRSNCRQSRFKKNRKTVEDLLFTTKRPLRSMLMLLFSMIEKISEMGFLYLRPNLIYKNVQDFLRQQELRLQDSLRRFKSFETMVRELTEAACRTYLIECGFSADNYAGEVEFCLKGLTVPVDKLTYETNNFLDYPGQWLPFSLQAKKKRVCERLTRFIHLVDFYVQHAYHRILKNSALLFMVELQNRTKQIPKELVESPKYIFKFGQIRRRNEALYGKILAGGGLKPIFQIGCSYEVESLVFNPTSEEFLKHLNNIFLSWRNAIFQYQNILPSEILNPYTQPIINGHMEEKICGDGPSIELLYNTDPDLFEVQDTISMIFVHNFQACMEYVDAFDYIRVFCVENDNLDVSKLKTIEDVGELKKLMEKYYGQLKAIENLERHVHIGAFRVRTRVLQLSAVPSIVRIIEVFHEHLPELGGKYMRALTERLEAAIIPFDRTPETMEENVESLVYVKEIQEQMDNIEEELDNCHEFADLIEAYNIVISDEDVMGYASLLPLLNKLKNEVEVQVVNRDFIIENILKEFESFKEKLGMVIEEVQQRLQVYDTYDPKTKSGEVISGLAECKDLILSYQEQAEKYIEYQQRLNVDVASYEDLDQLLLKVAQSQENWEKIAKWVTEAAMEVPEEGNEEQKDE